MVPDEEQVEEEISDEEPELEELEELEEEPELEVIEEPGLEDIDELGDLEDFVEEEEELEEEEFVEEALPEEEIIDERIYTVPLRKVYWTGNRLRRAKRAVRELQKFVERHMKPEFLVIQPEVNERIWSRGMQKPPRRIRIRATKNDEDLVRVYLAEG
jgi:large subunit ribosomal protein L31e